MSMTINQYVFPNIYGFTYLIGDKSLFLKTASKILPIGDACREFYMHGLVGAVYVTGPMIGPTRPGVYLFDNPRQFSKMSAAQQFCSWQRAEDIFGIRGQMSPLVLRGMDARVANPSPKNYINISPRTADGESVEAIVVLPQNHVKLTLTGCHAQVWHVIDGFKVNRTYSTVHADQVKAFSL